MSKVRHLKDPEAAHALSEDVPILLNGPMVRAVLAGRKTQTRRPVKLPPHVMRRKPPYKILFYNTGSGQYPGGHPGYTGDQPPGLAVHCSDGTGRCEATVQKVRSPFGIQGDRLYVRETFWIQHDEVARDYADTLDCGINLTEDDWAKVAYCATDTDDELAANCNHYSKRPSVHMPRWAARTWLDVLRIDVERVQDIDDDGARWEGVGHVLGDDYPEVSRIMQSAGRREAFAWLWESLYPGSWERNDWVWKCEFRRIEA